MLTARQKQLLEIIINEFIKTAEAVGSVDLPVKYELRISPATVRNEMARLVEMGYLDKPHASSGRIPTTLAFKYFLHDILEDMDEVDYRKQVTVNEELFQKRYNMDQLMLSAVRSLNEITNNAAIALLDDRIYHAGINSLLDNPEFQNLRDFKQVLAILEDYSDMMSIFKRYRNEDEVRVLIGEETGFKVLGKCAVVFSSIPIYGEKDGFLAIMGPNRMNYKKVIPAIKYISDQISSILSDWKINY